MNENNESAIETATAGAPEAEAKPKKKKVGNYPFRSKREILAEVAADDAFALHCLCVLHSLQTEREQETKATHGKNRQGFMSSHAVTGCTLAEKVKANEPLTGEEADRARSIVSRYGRQLAAHFRRVQIQENPELAKVAEIFSAA